MKTIHTVPLEKGILTSSYKREIRENIRNMKADSLCRIKDKITNHYVNHANKTATILRVSFIMFTIIVLAL